MNPIPRMARLPDRRQSGAALLVVMLLLVIITIAGIASMRGAIMQERMAANVLARSMAFQVAEAGLRQAELIARDGIVTFPSAGCVNGRCAQANPPAWQADGFWNASGTGYQTGAAISVGPSATIAPKFVIEDFGRTLNMGASTCIDVSKPCLTGSTQNVYRITSQASTANGGEVVLQSLYRR